MKYVPCSKFHALLPNKTQEYLVKLIVNIYSCPSMILVVLFFDTGKTVSDIKLMESNGEVRSNTNIYEKFHFSMLTEDVKQQFDSLNRKQVNLKLELG